MRQSHTSGLYKGKVFHFGGNGHGAEDGQFSVFDTTNNTYGTIQGKGNQLPPRNLCFATMTVNGSSFILLGGVNGDGKIWNFDVEKEIWTVQEKLKFKY